MDFCFFRSLHQLVAEPTKTTKCIKAVIDHILTSSPEKVIQSGATEMGISDHEFIYCTRKMSLLKLNEHYEISIRSIKNSSDEIFVEQLRARKFPDYSNYTCVNNAYLDFVTKFLSVINFVAPIKTLRVESNTKPWFDIDILNALNKCFKSQNRYKH